MTSSYAPMYDLRASLGNSGEANRQMVLLHIDKTLLAMRTGNGPLHRSSPLGEKESADYLCREEVLELRRRLFGGEVPVPGAGLCSSQVTSAPQSKATSNSTFSIEALPDDATRDLQEEKERHSGVSEMSILNTFANICRRPNVSSVVTGVALTALVDMLEFPCSFLTTEGIHTAIEAASETRAEVHDNTSHEVLLSRIFSVYVAALSHPAAATLDGDVHVRALGRMMVLATHTGSTQLLKRTVEKNMRCIVTVLFRRLTSLPSDEAAHGAVVEACVTVLRFISRLVSGEVASFDNDGREIELAVALGNSEVSVGILSNSGSGDDKMFPMERTVASIQLEGLTLAQDCLLLLSSLSRPYPEPLLDVLRNKISRALLIASVNTTQSIVLAQALRTVHLVIQCSSEDLVPQIYNFIRVLHLNPLEALTDELADVGLGQARSPVVRGASPSLTASPTTPISAPSPGSSGFGRLSPKQLRRKEERREIILDSLAELCSDSRFSAFCFIHYDLSWRYASVLPQLSQVLANHAYPVFSHNVEEVATVPWAQRRGGMAQDSKAAAQRRQKAAATADYRRDRHQRNLSATGRVLHSTQRTALDATTCMVSSFALRAIAAGESHSSFKDSCSPLSLDITASFCPELRRFIQKSIEEKKKLNQFAALFEESPIKKGIPFLLEHALRVPAGAEDEGSLRCATTLILAEPGGGREVGEALFRLSIVLNKRVLGDYIGEQGHSSAEGDVAPGGPATPAALFSVRFFEEQLVGFIHRFEFQNKPLLEAIREMVYLLSLPGESQKIDRVMEAFAKHWYEHNVAFNEHGAVVKDEAINPFHSQSGAFVLSFAIIILNTDQHSGKVAQQMKKEDFIKMNRGIDDGRDVAADYLGSVYDDVRQHEVVMADMMNRGFANDTTWRLEMCPCTNFLHHALRTNMTADEAEVVRSLACISSHDSGTAAATAASTTNAVLRTFDPFLLEATWKRSFLVFDGMLESAGEGVSLSIVASGSTVMQAVEEAHRLLPIEMAALQSSLQGICTLARAANALGFPSVADQCFMGLLKYVMIPDLVNAEEEVRSLYRSVPKLLCVRDLFALFVDIYGSLGDSWLPMSRLILDMYLMGLLALPASERSEDKAKSCDAAHTDSGGMGCGTAEGSCSTPVNALPVLLQDPGVCANVFAPLTAASAAGKDELTQKASSERGWLSSLFGGNDSSRVSTAHLSELRDAQGRICSSVPNMRQLLIILQRIASDPCAGCRFVSSLCAISSIGENTAEDGGNGGASVSGGGQERRVHGHPSGLDEASAYAASFELSFIGAIMSTVPSPGVHLTEYFTPLANCVTRLLREVDVYLCDARASDSMRSYWCAIGSRVVGASLYLVSTYLRSECVSTIIEQLWASWMSFSSVLFAGVVAQPLAAFLYDHVLGLCGEEMGAASEEGKRDGVRPRQYHHDVPLLLAPFAAHATAISDTVVQLQVSCLLSKVVRHCRYSVVDDTEGIVSLCLALSVWQQHIRSAATSTGIGDPAEKSVATDESAKSVAAAATFFSSENTMAEILGLCGRNVLLHNVVKATGGAGAEAGEWWCSLWVYVLRGLGALALCSPDPRDGSEAIFCLQRALLDSEAHELPLSAVAAVYRDMLIPLTERLCVPKAQVQTGLRWTRANHSNSGAKNDAALMASPDVMGSFSTSHSLPALGEGNGYSEATAFPIGTSLASWRSRSSIFVSTEVKCRLLSLVPKVFLRYIAALITQLDLLVYLWKQILGTLYAIYSAYSIIEDSAGSNGGGNALYEEAILIQEAVEETVKNMVYVIVATWSDSASGKAGGTSEAASMHAEGFWTATISLLNPFAFSAPLIDFIVQAGLAQVEAGPHAEASQGVSELSG